MENKYCYGIDIGGTTVKIGLFQTDGTLLEKWEIVTRTANGGEAILPDIAESVLSKLNEKGIQKEDVIGLGVGVPAATKDGIVNSTSNIGWGYKNVKKELEELTGYRVNVGNDANVAALGEMWKGGGQGYQNQIMVTLGTGVGGGIIIDGHIHTGIRGAGGEIGHLCVQEGETEVCGCGRTGCLEQYASATGIVRLAKRRLANNTDDTVLNAEAVTAKDVFDAVKAGDKVAMEIAEDFGKYLGNALSEIAVILDPELFVIGGGVSRAGEVLLDYIKKNYMKKALWDNDKVEFALAKLGNDAGMYGAAKLALMDK
ncbi:MAG: ROK family glucokinase [Faecalimonas sp.]|nr:ROK family glucokinase [Faecalimonas sp.]